MYKDETGKCDVEEFIKKAHHKIQKKFDFILKMVKEQKDFLKEPYVKHFSVERYKKLYELRLKATGMMIRIIYCEHDGDIILLHAFLKRDNRDTEQALGQSLKMMDKLGEHEAVTNEYLEEVLVK